MRLDAGRSQAQPLPPLRFGLADAERHGFVIGAVERHGTKRKHIRVFGVARKPG